MPSPSNEGCAMSGSGRIVLDTNAVISLLAGNRQLAEQLDAAEYVATLLVTNDGHFGGIPALTTQAC